jgi:hypothetical protein
LLIIKIFFEKYQTSVSQKKNCFVEHKTRLYGSDEIQEYFEFEKNPNVVVEDVTTLSFLPSTIEQMAHFSFNMPDSILPGTFSYDTILYQNVFFSIETDAQFGLYQKISVEYRR